MKIVIDSAIPFIEGIFEPFAEVVYQSGELIDAKTVHNATAIIVRTRTKCNRELLQKSTVKHIATATIGDDHIDLQYCRENNITVATAAGCNARAVLQWVAAALNNITATEKTTPKNLTIGIVGLGNVGTLIEKYASKWGFNILCCDPPREEKIPTTELGNKFQKLDTIVEKADIITLHTPLNSTTRHLINNTNIQRLKKNAIIINTSRGEVIESQALMEREDLKLYIDVWEKEPKIEPAIAKKAIIATPHIAGYTAQGKANATEMAVNKIAKQLNIPMENWQPNIPQQEEIEIEWEEMQQTIAQYFDIQKQSEQLKNNIEAFETMRNEYQYRNEYF